jgi:hypothetical protein
MAVSLRSMRAVAMGHALRYAFDGATLSEMRLLVSLHARVEQN